MPVRLFSFPADVLGRARAAALLKPRKVRMRLTLLYGALFIVSGTVLLAVTYLLVAGTTTSLILIDGTRDAPGGSRPPQVHHYMGDDAGAAGSPGNIDRQAEALHQQAEHTHQAMIDNLMFNAVIALAITSVVSIWLGWVVAGRVLRPLRSMTTTIQRITARNVHERLAVEGPRDELKDLADTVDGLLGRLETALDSHKRFVANAAHELRTPLTLEHALLEESLIDRDPTVDTFRTNFERLLAISKQQGRLLEALLFLSTSERGLDRPEPVDLAALADEAVQAVRPAADRRGLRLDARVAPACLEGDPVLVGRLVANLLDNALSYNVPDGRVDLTVGTRDGRAFLTAANTGQQVPEDQVDRLFHPFQRLDRSADDGHHGLGLSIVRSIVDAHGAALTARAGTDGGLVVDIVFPERHQLSGKHPKMAGTLPR
ncbi:two-component sensor histidine kinase [Streptomyces griseoviridis]|nr:two-component sensor histidine kinase [Streptomyces griseoviridis]